jgi:hypothetical protein
MFSLLIRRLGHLGRVIRMGLRGYLRPEADLREVREEIFNHNERLMLMTISANVQKLIDEVHQNSDLAKSMIAGQAILSSQIADLKDKVATLEAGQVTSAEDIQGINDSVAALEETDAALKGAVPANTPAAPSIDNPTPPAS